MIQLWSSDNAALMLARTILIREPKTSLQIFLGEIRPKNVFSASDLWKDAVSTANLKFKKLGIAIDQGNHEENAFLQDTCDNSFFIHYELLSDFANRQLADTVEFRRLARKYLRPAKHAHCDAVLFLSGTLSDETSRKILAKTLGTQITSVFVTDFLPKELFIAEKKQQIEIFTDQNIERTHFEAEKILRTKLAKNIIQKSPVTT
jgi:hypothetical protein